MCSEQFAIAEQYKTEAAQLVFDVKVACYRVDAAHSKAVSEKSKLRDITSSVQMAIRTSFRLQFSASQSVDAAEGFVTSITDLFFKLGGFKSDVKCVNDDETP